MNAGTAAAASLVRCHACGLLAANRSHPPGHTAHCPRCDAPVHSRKPNSLQQVWAWWLAGAITFIPANIYPMLLTNTLVEKSESTIVGGVVDLIHYGSYGIAAIVFIASIIIPLMTQVYHENYPERERGTLFSRFSGTLENVDRIVFTGAPESDLDPDQQDDSDALATGIYDGAKSAAAGVVAVERTDTEPTTLAPFTDAGIATVDHADLVAGRVALVFSLLGAGGDYGVKPGADSFLPELMNPADRPAATP